MIGEPLGRGGMAEVFAAQSPAGVPAAVKILHAGVASDPDLLARFWREVEVAGDIGHKGVVQVIDHGLADDGRPFLAMELLHGSTLAELASRSEGVSLDALLEYVDQVLDVLAAAHDRAVIHRDLKPANLFVTDDGRVKVLDFGIARLLDAGVDTLKTATGVAIGTVTYMAPEQAAGQRDQVDGRTDLFAVGAILFRLLSGRRVHEGRNGGEILMKAASEQAPALLSVAPHVPALVAAVTDRALSFDKHQRFPDARAMRAALAQARIGSVGPARHGVALPTGAAPAPADVTVFSGGESRIDSPVVATAPSVVAASSFAAVPLRVVFGAIGVVALFITVVSAGSAAIMLFVLEPDSLEPVGSNSGTAQLVELDALIGAYRASPGAAHEKYRSTTIRTSGSVSEVGEARLSFRMGGAAEPWLECSPSSPSELSVGARVTVEGMVTAWHEGPRRVILGSCVIVP